MFVFFLESQPLFSCSFAGPSVGCLVGWLIGSLVDWLMVGCCSCAGKANTPLTWKGGRDVDRRSAGQTFAMFCRNQSWKVSMDVKTNTDL